MIIGIDFDGTIVDHRFPEIGAPVPGAIEAMKMFNYMGAKIILWTMRDENFLKDACNYLDSHGVKIYGANLNPQQSSWTNSPKAYANIYIDDMAFGCPLIRLEGFARPCVDWGIVRPGVEKMLIGKMLHPTTPGLR